MGKTWRKDNPKMDIRQLAFLRQTPSEKKRKKSPGGGVVELLENAGARTFSLDVLSTSQIQGSG